MMGRKYKGTFGYLKKRRIRSLIRSAFELAAVLAIYFTAWAVLKDNKNVFTIMAALLCIPTGKSIVDTIMCFLATGCSDDAHARIEEVLAAAPGTFPASYDLYLTGYQKNFALSHAAVADGAVCALTESDKCDVEEGQKHIRTVLGNDGVTGYTVRIFRDTDKYIERISRMGGNPATERDARAMQVLHAVSL